MTNYALRWIIREHFEAEPRGATNTASAPKSNPWEDTGLKLLWLNSVVFGRCDADDHDPEEGRDLRQGKRGREAKGGAIVFEQNPDVQEQPFANWRSGADGPFLASIPTGPVEQKRTGRGFAN